MVLIKQIELELTQNRNIPEAVEDTLIKDSVIDLTNADFSQVNDFEDVDVGEIRKKIVVDTGYSGKPVTRKQFSKNNWVDNSISIQISDEEGDFTGDSDVSDEFNETKVSNDSLTNDNQDLQSENSEELSEADNEQGEQIDDEDESEIDEGDDINLSDFQKKDIEIFSAKTKDTDKEVAKGISVKNQLSVWESLLESRIKLQPGLIDANKLYQKNDFLTFKTKLKPEDDNILSNAYTSLGNLMKTLLELQEVLLNSSQEYISSRNVTEQNSNKDQEASDNESISSSLASGKDDDDDLTEVKNSSLDEPKSKKIKLGNYSDHLEELYKDFKPFKDKTIQTWNDKTRLTSGKISNSDFSAFDQPTLKQIEQILLDKTRLIRKTQLKRSDYQILGKQIHEEQIEDDETVKDNERYQKEYDPEIFDDDDFYHKLLRDFISRKCTDVSDTNKHGRQWLEIQHLRSKMKRKVDTRCTKGRKLRYTVHNKLVNFMAPIPCNKWSEEAENQLFKSLFGKINEQSN